MAHFTTLWLLISCFSTNEFNSVHLIHSLTTPATFISIDTAETTAVSSTTSSTELTAESNTINLSTMSTTEPSTILSIESSLSNTESSTDSPATESSSLSTDSSTESSLLSTGSSIESSLPTESSTESLSSTGSSTESSSQSAGSSTESSSLPTGSTESSLTTGSPTESFSPSAGISTESSTNSSTESSSLSTGSSTESSSLSAGSSTESTSLPTGSSAESSSLSTDSSTESSSTGSSTESSSLSTGSSTESSSLTTGSSTESSSLSAGLSTNTTSRPRDLSTESSTLMSSVAPSSDMLTDNTTSIEFTTEFSTESTRNLSSFSAEITMSTELTTYPFNNWFNISNYMSSEFTSDPSTKSTVGITSSTGCNLSTVDLDGVCGFDNTTWGVCRENSACQFQTETKQGNRTCQCFHGNIAVIDLTGKRSCKKVATDLLFNETFYELTMNSDEIVNSQVLNISLDIEDDIKDLVAINVTLHPSDSFLKTEIHSNAAVSILTSSTLPQSQKTYRFVLEAEMTYGDVIVKDVTSVIVNVIRVFPNSTLIRGTFVIDGTRKGSLVYDISVDLGSIDALALRLSADPSVSLFELSQNRIVCTEEVNLTKLGARDHSVGKLVSVNISNSQKTVLTLHVAVLVSKYHTAVAESSVPGTTIIDFDSLDRSFNISFATPTQQHFEHSGNSVLLSHELDYEDIDQRKFIFSLEIALKGNSSVATEVGVEIATLDENDEAPEFNGTDYSFTVSAESPRETIIGYLGFRDFDTAVTEYTYVIENSQYRSYFQLKQVDSRTGALITKQGLKSLNSSIEFNVTVSDGINQCTVPALVTVKLSILPQELEVVGNSFNVSLLEEEPVGIFVVNASLANYTGYMMLDNNFFNIDNVTGEVTTARSIDREGEYVKVVNVVAKHVDGTCAFKIVSNITVIVLDINDNPPVFSEEGLYRTSLKENSRAGSEVFQVKATDKDEGENSTLTFSLSGENSNYFSIDNRTGVITVANSSILDREQISALEVIVLVEDGGDTLEQALRLSANATLTITLLDVNDNNPRFQQTPYNACMFCVQENGTANQRVGNVSATDLDLLENSRIRYSLKEGDWGFFWINETTGEMWTKQTINREEHSNFTIVVLAYDNGSPALNDLCTVFINVTDVNDNAPEFDRKHQYVSIKEGIDCINQTIVQVRAKDLDDGVNGQVYYTIENSLLIIDNVTGNVTCSILGLDFENKTHQDLIKDVRIFAFDRGSPVLNGTLQLTVTLEDVNDNPPTFVEHAPEITVPSAIFKTVNSTVIVLSVLDKDSVPQFDLEIFSDAGMDLLKIDNQGVVKVKSIHSFAPGQVTKMEYKVVATDRDNTDLQSSTNFTLIVNASDFGNIELSNTDFHMTIEENKNASEKTTIGKIDAFQGINTSVTFSLETVDDRFSINRTNGEVYCLAELDREREDHIILFANVSAGGWHYYAAVHVEVLDVNDNPPTFSVTSQRLITDCPENSEKGKHIIQASASDPDSGLNGTVNYTLLETNTPFQVNTFNGSIYVSGPLDRENVSQYSLTVVARDQGHPPLNSSTTVIITLLDVNDNPPIFNLSYCQIDVLENIGRLHQVGQVEAFDRDSNSNGLNYSVEQSTKCPFFIQNSNDKGRTVGVLKLSENESLDYETTHNYNCTVRVFDTPSEGPQLNSSMIITFNIIDINDNAPVIDPVNTSITIPRDVRQGFVIVPKLNASDKDSGINAEIYFSFDTDFPDYFNVSNDTGEVQTIKSLRNLPSQLVNLTVLARDRGEPSLSSALLIRVIILDNNTAPQFTKVIYNVNISEDVSYMGSVFTVSADDFENGHEVYDFEYRILSALNESGHNVKNYFEINKKSGIISNTIPIDRETIGNKITVNLSVTDKGEPPKSDYAVLIITVKDINDNPPKFDNDQPWKFININQTNCQPGQMSITVKARDEDIAPNNVTRYTLERLIPTMPMPMPMPIPMQINNETGELSLTHSMCSEMYNGKTIIGSVKAFDNELEGGMALLVITVNLTNTEPKFTQPNYTACLPANAKAGTPLNIKDFYANDTDGGVIKYAIKNGNLNCSEAVFSIDSLTGVITLNYELDNVLQRHFILTVTATDSGGFNSDHVKTGTATVKVSVLGGNETCYEEKEVTAPQADAKECKIYKTLFIVQTVFLSLLILLTVLLCYKWRTTVSDREEISGNAESSDTFHPSHHSLKKAGINGKEGIYKNKKIDISTTPPSLPRRDGVKGTTCNSTEDTVNPPLCSNLQEDNTGYLTPSEYGQDSNQTLSPHYSRSELAEDASGYLLLKSDIFIDADSRNPDPAQCSPDYLHPKQMSVKQGRESERRTNLIEDAKNLDHETSISSEETDMSIPPPAPQYVSSEEDDMSLPPPAPHYFNLRMRDFGSSS